MKLLLSQNRNLIDSIAILLTAGLLTGLYCASNMNLDSISSYSSALAATLIVPDDPGQFFVQQSLLNLILCLVIFCFGLSVIGIPLIQFSVFLKGFQIGFSSALFLLTYHLKGLLGIAFTLIPQFLFDIAAIGVIACAAMKLSGLLICALLDRSFKLDFAAVLNQKINSFLLSAVLVIVSSAFKSTIGILLMDLFIKLE